MQIANFKHHGSIEALDKEYPCWTYVGRENKHFKESPLANPFPTTQSRRQVIQAYRSWLWAQIKRKNPAILDALRQLNDDTVLVCWCHPQPCHAEIIIKAWHCCKAEGLI